MNRWVYYRNNLQCSHKRDFLIEKLIAQHFLSYTNVYQTPLPFYVTQIINPFLYSVICANYEKVEEFQSIVIS